MASLKGKRIFYIEDDINNRVIATIILEQAGAKVGFERWGGLEAVMKLEAFLPIDIILCDLAFPRQITGYDVFERIRAVPSLAHIPIVAITSADPTTELPKVRAKGFNGFISKPINMMTFAHDLSKVLDGEAVWVVA
jgi:CheY-like chemotaxis protein